MTTNAERSVRLDIKRANEKLKAALALSLPLASKIASVIVHADEWTSPYAHPADGIALRQAIDDPEVRAWIKAVAVLAPVKRNR